MIKGTFLFLNADRRICNADIRRFFGDNLRESAFDLRKFALKDNL